MKNTEGEKRRYGGRDDVKRSVGCVRMAGDEEEG
jgi:hypothetical protein